MKRVLFASTALVAFAGAAAADVTLTGNAEMGIFDNGADDSDVQFHTDLDVTFTMSGETDGGLTFGASIDIDEAGDGAEFENPDDQSGETIFISGGFGTLTMGDTDGAVDWAMTEVLFNSGSIQDNEEHVGYNGNAGHDGSLGLSDGQVLRYDYSFGDFGIAVSAEQISGVDPDPADDTVLGIGFRYSFDLGGSDLGFGLGYQDSDIADVIGVSLNGGFGDFNAGLNYMELDVDDDVVGNESLSFDHIGVGIGWSSGAISLHGNYGQFDYEDGTEQEGFGLTAGYDLGGGAIIQLGYGDNDDRGDDFDTYSFGVRMNF